MSYYQYCHCYNMKQKYLNSHSTTVYTSVNMHYQCTVTCGEHPHKHTFLDFENSSSSWLLSTGDPSKGCLTASRPVPTAPQSLQPKKAVGTVVPLGQACLRLSNLYSGRQYREVMKKKSFRSQEKCAYVGVPQKLQKVPGIFWYNWQDLLLWITNVNSHPSSP